MACVAGVLGVPRQLSWDLSLQFHASSQKTKVRPQSDVIRLISSKLVLWGGFPSSGTAVLINQKTHPKNTENTRSVMKAAYAPLRIQGVDGRGPGLRKTEVISEKLFFFCPTPKTNMWVAGQTSSRSRYIDGYLRVDLTGIRKTKNRDFLKVIGFGRKRWFWLASPWNTR